MALKSVVGGFQKTPKKSDYDRDTCELRSKGTKRNKIKRDNSSKRFQYQTTSHRDNQDMDDNYDTDY